MYLPAGVWDLVHIDTIFRFFLGDAALRRKIYVLEVAMPILQIGRASASVKMKWACLCSFKPQSNFDHVQLDLLSTAAGSRSGRVEAARLGLPA